MAFQEAPAATKAGVRRSLLASRKALSPDERAEKSRLICAACRELPAFREAPIICSYVNFRDEVETGELVRSLLAAGRRVAVPAHFHGVDLPLVFSEIRSWSELVPNHFGIPQPPREKLRILPVAAISLFLVPGSGFDLSGRRLGYGLGFYDRVLPSASPGVLKVGLAFEAQVVERVPTDEHDVPMDCIQTELRLITAPRAPGPSQEVHRP
jgi:5-formyltetrahydrofolate cyclo-ligase